MPDDVEVYLATAGTIEVNDLSETGGSIDFPVEFALRGLSLYPLAAPADYHCLHVASVTVARE